jgi:DHA1 family inner membrane transport protein
VKHSLRLQIIAFTATRTVLNTAYRMVYPFLAVFGRGLGVELPALSLALTIRSLSGSLGTFLAWTADRYGRKAGMLFGLSLFIVGSGVVFLFPSYPALVITLALTAVGKYVFDPSMQAYLGDRVVYQQRGTVLALTELAWSASFILGIPLVGVLIARYGWRSPFPFFTALGLLALVSLAKILPKGSATSDQNSAWGHSFRLVFTSAPALIGLAMGLAFSIANEVVNLVFGVWMEEDFGLKIATLGFASAVIGLSELSGETLVAFLTDRLGKPRALTLGLVLNSLAALALPIIGRSLPGALTGLFLFYITFEFTLVSSIPLLTEIVPGARATLMAASIAGMSLGRALGDLLASPLYLFAKTLPPLHLVSSGILLSALAAILFNGLALLALRYLRRTRQFD